MRAGIALGSNLGDRLSQLRKGRAAVLGAPGISLPERLSRVYETEPVGAGAGDAAFLNAVMEVEISIHPVTLLDVLQQIEASMGRPSKRPRNSPRVLDLDVLYVGNTVLHNEEIVIPHPRLHLRRFVLQPLCDIRPELILPGQELTIAQLLEQLDDPASVFATNDSLTET